MPLTNADANARCCGCWRGCSHDSYVAGATVINLDEATPRFSDDLDIFHEAEEAVARSAEADAAALAQTLPPTAAGGLFQGAPVTPRNAEQLKVLRQHRATVRGSWPTVE